MSRDEVVSTSGSGQEPADPAPTVVAFDVGEVLIDETRVWATWAALLGVSPFTLGAIIGAAIVQGEEYAAALRFASPNVDWEDLIEEHEARYGGFGPQDLYPDVVPCLTALREAGFVVAVAGNQPAPRDEQLRALDLPVDHVATSAALGAEKPDPAFYDALLALVGVDEEDEVLYVGDRVDNDVLPAAELGLRTCWLQRGPWGRLQDLPDGAPEPDLVLEGLGELPMLLQGWRDGAG